MEQLPLEIEIFSELKIMWQVACIPYMSNRFKSDRGIRGAYSLPNCVAA